MENINKLISEKCLTLHCSRQRYGTDVYVLVIEGEEDLACLTDEITSGDTQKALFAEWVLASPALYAAYGPTFEIAINNLEKRVAYFLQSSPEFQNERLQLSLKLRDTWLEQKAVHFRKKSFTETEAYSTIREWAKQIPKEVRYPHCDPKYSGD